MRHAFVKGIELNFTSHDDLVLLLGDISVYAFKNLKNKYPKRVINIGILEQTMISLAAGLSKFNFNPIVHSIAPFLIERALEQIKIDFGYQKLRGNIFSVGSSFDYSKLGATHHCPADVNILLNIPHIEILIPGSAFELQQMISNHLNNDKLSYFRLTEYPNKKYIKCYNNQRLKEGERITIYSVGPTLDITMEAVSDLNVEVIYINKLDLQAIKKEIFHPNENVLFVEPFYVGTMASYFYDKFHKPLRQYSIGVPREFIYKYGNFRELRESISLTSRHIRTQVKEILNSK